MEGSNWVALASVLTTAGLAVFSAWWQRRGERERAQEQARERQSERWLNERLSVYLRFLRAADASQSGIRYRIWWMRSAAPATAGPAEEDAGRLDLPEGAYESLQECGQALSEMRLFAPAAVTSACARFVEAARELEHFSSMDAVWTAHGDRPPAEPDADPYGDSWERMRLAADDAVAAMRADLGRDPLPADLDLYVDLTVLGC